MLVAFVECFFLLLAVACFVVALVPSLTRSHLSSFNLALALSLHKQMPTPQRPHATSSYAPPASTMRGTPMVPGVPIPPTPAGNTTWSPNSTIKVTEAQTRQMRAAADLNLSMLPAQEQTMINLSRCNRHDGPAPDR